MFRAGNVTENRNSERHVIFNNIKHFWGEEKEHPNENTCWIWFYSNVIQVSFLW